MSSEILENMNLVSFKTKRLVYPKIRKKLVTEKLLESDEPPLKQALSFN